MLKNLSIKMKFTLIVGLTVIGITGEMLQSWHGTESARSLDDLHDVHGAVAYQILSMRRQEKNFMMRLDQKSADEWKKENQKEHALIDQLSTAVTAEEIDAQPEINSLRATLGEYEKAFQGIIDLETKAGLTAETGYQGQMRKAAHQAESSIATLHDDKAEIGMLVLRRHEKDFMLRRDESYIAKFEATFREIQDRHLPDAVTKDLDDYRNNFLALAEARRAIGLNGESQGLDAAMRKAGRHTDDSLATLQNKLQEKISLAERVNRISGLALGLVIIGLAVTGAILIARTVTGPIHRLTDTTRGLSAGQTGLIISDLNRQDEIGPLAQALEQWRLSLIERAEKLALENAAHQREQARNDRIAQATRSFEGTVVSMLDTIRQAVDQLTMSANSLSANAEQTQRQSQAVSAATDLATANVETVSAASTQLAASIGEISRQVAKSADTSRSAAQEAADANRKISGLQDSAQKIGDVVNLINDIASQTNLLALNATIESARAGEAGKGFAVVANEVKHLAGQTGRATEDITQQVSSVQQETRSTVDAIENISRTITVIAELSAAIASAVEEQGAATSEIAKSVEQASAGTRDVALNISGVARTAAETGAMAHAVNDSANHLKRQSETLESAVRHFLETVRTA